jgi:hypothetical protein
MEDKNSSTCLTLACQQVVRIYLELQRLQLGLRHEGLETMTRAVERGEVAAWFQTQMKNAK